MGCSTSDTTKRPARPRCWKLDAWQAPLARRLPHPEGSTTRLWLVLVQAPLQSDLVIDEPSTQRNHVEVDSLYRIDDAHPPVHRDAIVARMAEIMSALTLAENVHNACID
jgi:hypothetical protein